MPPINRPKRETVPIIPDSGGERIANALPGKNGHAKKTEKPKDFTGVYEAFGVVFGKRSGAESIADECPWCGKDKFHVNTENGLNDTANSTIYTAPSAAMVFAAGTIQWSWGLDSFGGGASYVNAGVQRMTSNILARFTQ